jgi:DNA-binding CsgD family transcriptional regulator
MMRQLLQRYDMSLESSKEISRFAKQNGPTTLANPMMHVHGEFAPYTYAMWYWLSHVTQDLTQQVHLILDLPWGYAVEHPLVGGEHKTIILTDNPTTEYWEDLASFQPTVLITGNPSPQTLLEAIHLAASSQPRTTLKLTPPYLPLLTPKERLILRLVAFGKDNKEIMKFLDISKGTLEGHVTHLNSKLGVKNRTQLAFYYWGMKYEYLAKIEPAILARLQAATPAKNFNKLGKTPDCTQGKPSDKPMDFPVFKSPYEP